MPNIRSWIEATGATAIVVSLLFLAYELKRANEIAEAEATSTVYEMANDLMLASISDKSLRQVVIKAYGGSDEALSLEEKFLFNDWLTYIYNVSEVAWKYQQLGLMNDDDMRLRFAELCTYISGSPAVARDWARRRNTMLPGFYDAANDACVSTSE